MIVEKYDIRKVSCIISGGKERYESVWNGLRQIEKDGFVFIHDAPVRL